jgi:hypothetical protein
VAWGRDDPNAAVYDDAARRLGDMTTGRGTALTVVRVASPGRVEVEGEVAPASHMNFVVANKAVIVPLYGDARAGQFAMDALASLYPEARGDRPALERVADRRRQLPLHHPAGAGMTRTLTVAALQSSYGADMDANIRRTADLVREGPRRRGPRRSCPRSFSRARTSASRRRSGGSAPPTLGASTRACWP